MRKEFCAWLQAYASSHPEVIILTGDLGFQALEGVRQAIGERFVNVGVSEQNMVSVAAGLASEGLVPFCYSIAPFVVFRATEQIRLDVCIHGLKVRIVGNGGGYGYGIMGSTHHALEDIAMMSSLPHMTCFIPASGNDVAPVCDAMMRCPTASYLRLNFGQLGEGLSLSTQVTAVRRIERVARDTRAPRVTVLALGAIVLNVPPAAYDDADVFVVSQIPLPELPAELVASIRTTGKLLVLEEHVARGGLGEHVALLMLQAGLHPEITLRCAAGYPTKTYGSQQFHQRESGLDGESVLALIRHLA